MSGQYLGAAGQDVRIYMAKTWAEVTSYSAHEVCTIIFTIGRTFLFLIIKGRHHRRLLWRISIVHFDIVERFNREIVRRPGRPSTANGILEQFTAP